MKQLFTCVLLCIAMGVFAQDTITLIDEANSSNALIYGGETYKIAWGHSDDNYYKQEYLRDNDKLEEFNKMITIDMLVTDLSVYDAVSYKVSELEERKKKDPVVNYQVIENEEFGEYLVDFLMSADGVYEWNCYRYKSVSTKKGKAIMVFAYSQRTYKGAEIDPDEFFEKFGENRNKWIQILTSFTLPAVKLTD